MVSVVVPMYNVEYFVSQCIESILRQTYHDMEIILVDDGSPDKSGKIAENYAKKDKRIIVFHKPNGGLSDARNYGIERAHGKYITFVDSDDFIFPTMIENLVKIAESEAADFVECKNIRCLEEDTLDTVEYRETSYSKKIYSGRDKMKQFLAAHGIKTTAWAKLYKLVLFDDVRYPVGKYHEDVFTTYKLIHRANKVVTSEFHGYVYRINNNSITTSDFSEKSLDAIEGKIEQACFIYDKYPDLSRLANMGIVYACNACMKKMAKSDYNNSQVLKEIQKLYRKYGKDYIFENTSLFGKFIVIASLIDVKAALLLLRQIS